MPNCLTSLSANNLYEGAMPVWQLDFLKKDVNETNVMLRAPQWPHYQACKGAFSTSQLVHVAADSGKDRFLTELVIPAIVDSISFVEKLVERHATFKDLAVSGAHAMLWAFIGAVDEALAASGADTEKEMWLLKLYEASLMFTVRVRQQLSPLQITLDNLSSADVLRTRCITEKD